MRKRSIACAVVAVLVSAPPALCPIRCISNQKLATMLPHKNAEFQIVLNAAVAPMSAQATLI